MAGGSLIATTWQDMSVATREWDALAGRASEPNPFLESWYLVPSLRHLARPREVALLRFELNGQLAGLLPVTRRNSYYRWPIPHLSGWLHPNSFCGTPLVARGAEAAFWRAVLEWADRHAGSALFLHLAALPATGPVHAALARVAAEQRRELAVVHEEERAMLQSGLTPDAYLAASLSGKKRKELRRQSKRLEELGTLTAERQQDAAGLDRWCNEFLALEAGGWKGAAGSALSCAPATARLFRDALAGAARRGKLERRTLRLDGQPLAMLASFVTPPGAFAYKTAFDERFSRFSPGVMLQCHNLEILDHPGVEWCDSCANADHPMIDHIWRERRKVHKVSIAIGGGLRRAVFHRLARAETARMKPEVLP